jgi:hypothetical protein
MERKDYVCDEHQKLASECGCLAEHNLTHCQCGMRFQSDGVNMVCPVCDWQRTVQEELDIYPRTAPEPIDPFE